MASRIGSCGLAMALLLLSGGSLAFGYKVATAKDAVSSPTKADTKFPQVSQVITSLHMFAPDILEYVDNPDTICTIIAPNDEAMLHTMDTLGEYVGLVLQNKTMQGQILNYHVISGQKLKAEDMGTKVKSVNTRGGETLWFVQYNGVPYVAFGREYVQPIEIADIQAGGCLIHIVGSTLMAPPSILPTIEQWLSKAGNPDALKAPKALWLKEDLPALAAGSSADTSAAKSTAVTVDTPAAANKAAGSSTHGGMALSESGKQQGAVSDAHVVQTSLTLLAAVGLWMFVVLHH